MSVTHKPLFLQLRPFLINTYYVLCLCDYGTSGCGHSNIIDRGTNGVVGKKIVWIKSVIN